MFDQVAHCGLDPAITAAVAAKIQVKQGCERNFEPLQQAPEVLNMASAEWRNGHEGRVDKKAICFGKARQHNPFGIPFDQHDEARK